jgi:hypothetical protein
MRRLNLFVLSVLAIGALGGCDPSRFYLEATHPITCRIYAPIATVAHSFRDFTVSEGGTVAMSVAELTQYRITMNVGLLQGDGYRLMLRPVAEESVVDSGLVLVLSRSHSRLDSAGHTLIDLPNVHLRPNAQLRHDRKADDGADRVGRSCDRAHWQQQCSCDLTGLEGDRRGQRHLKKIAKN